VLTAVNSRPVENIGCHPKTIVFCTHDPDNLEVRVNRQKIYAHDHILSAYEETYSMEVVNHCYHLTMKKLCPALVEWYTNHSSVPEMIHNITAIAGYFYGFVNLEFLPRNMYCKMLQYCSGRSWSINPLFWLVDLILLMASLIWMDI